MTHPRAVIERTSPTDLMQFACDLPGSPMQVAAILVLGTPPAVDLTAVRVPPYVWDRSGHCANSWFGVVDVATREQALASCGDRPGGHDPRVVVGRPVLQRRYCSRIRSVWRRGGG